MHKQHYRKMFVLQFIAALGAVINLTILFLPFIMWCAGTISAWWLLSYLIILPYFYATIMTNRERMRLEDDR